MNFGAWDGKHFSNCNHLIANQWKGCFIEGNIDRYRELVATYSENKDVVCLNFFIKYQSRLLLIEFNPTIPNDVIFIQEKSNNVHQGSSLLALIILGKEKGYELVCCTTCNAFFVKKELYSFFNLKSNSIYSLYQPLCDGRIFHGYDSKIFVVGMSKLLWSNISIDSSDFQVLPKSMRYFNDAQ
uniref:Uncharacterized protein n=1 Tax=Chlorobium chlorochromatii (strain CaD3) TaxID=340177 RepID=Q3ASK6_CHLCH